MGCIYVCITQSALQHCLIHNSWWKLLVFQCLVQGPLDTVSVGAGDRTRDSLLTRRLSQQSRDTDPHLLLFWLT